MNIYDTPDIFLLHRQKLEKAAASGRFYFSGTPLTFGEMSRKLPGGAWERYLKPFVPVNGSLNHNRFQPDAEQPVVCVTSLAQMAIFRALSHQSLHTNLPERQRRTGWRYENGMPVYRATEAVLENVERLKRVGVLLISTVVAVRRDAANFEPFDREPHQFRSIAPVPFETSDVSDVTLDLWPDNVEACEPWPANFDTSSYEPYRPDSAAYLNELCAEQDFLDSLAGVRR